MSRNSRRELGKLRELAWHFLEGEKCCFCHKPLLSEEQRDFMQAGHVRFGNATAPPLDLPFTIHHENENHDDNRKRNRRLSHDTCHKTHHARKVFRTWRKQVAA